MYNIPDYKTKDHRKVIAFMHAHPFAVVTGVDAQMKPVATHVPLLIKEKDDKLYLQGHIMRNTDHHTAFVQNENVLVIFSGPHTYVSASWYADQKQGSTWNYTTVHAHGKLVLGDDALLLDVLKETTAKFENNPSSPSLFEHLEQDYVQPLLKAIVAFEIQVSSIDHVFKLSQDKDDESYKNIIDQLHKRDHAAQEIALLMKNNAG